MRKHFFDEYGLAPIVNSNYQPVLIFIDIKNYITPY
jgi:hypothetical protein